MRQSTRRLFGTGRAVLGVARDTRLSFLSAATAYYAFVSTLPLVLLGLAIGTLLGGDSLATTVLTAVSGVLSPGGEELLKEALLGAVGRTEATAVGIVGFLWGGLRVFRGLNMAFGTIYGTAMEQTLLSQFRDATVALAALGVGIGVLLAGHLVVARFGVPTIGIPSLGTMLALTIVLTPLYVVFPDVSIRVRDALPGAVTAAIGWTLLSVVFAVYAAHAGQFDVYGVVGGVLLFVTWLYFGAQIVLFGAIINATVAGDRQLQHPSRRKIGRDPTMTGNEADDGDAGRWTPDEPSERDAQDDAVASSGADSRDETREPSKTSVRDDEAVSSEDAARNDGTTEWDDRVAGIRELRAEIERLEDDLDERAAHREEVEELREEVRRLEDDIDDRTVHREEIEGDLKRYVRRRVRRGHARGWGPYLVLLYGTVMTIGAFQFLGGGWAVLAMVVIWLSTLGLYVLMALFGLTFKLLGTPGQLLDRIRDWRD